MKRREFIGGAGVFAFAPFMGAAAGGGEPYARIGVMTDTHVGKDEASCGRVKMALELFRAKKAGLIVNCGDIADHFYPTGYQAYRKVFNGVFPDKATRPQELYVYAWHDAYDYKDFGRDTHKCWKEAFAEVKAHLEAPNEPYSEGVFKGLPFLVFPQFLDFKLYREAIDRTVKANPGKPVLVFDHVPPGGTVYDSYNWGDRRRTDVLKDYPQVIDVSGHVHGSLRSDAFIWQKEFTVINAGCLQTWGGLLACTVPTRKEAFGVLVMEFFRDHLVVRRYDVRDGSEICPETPWNVALPFAAATAPYERARAKARSVAPQFPDGAALSATADAKDFKGFELSFPEAAGSRRAFLYRLETLTRDGQGGWRTLTFCEKFGDFYLRPKDRTGKATALLSPSYFKAGETYRFRVTPQNEYGVQGRAIETEARAPDSIAAGTTVFRSDDPMNEMEFARDGDDARVKASACGEFFSTRRNGSNYNRLAIPAGTFAGPLGTRFRVTIDAHIRQAEDGFLWSLKLVKPKNGGLGATARMRTPGGDSGRLVYVIDFTKAAGLRYDGDTYQVEFEWGDRSSVKLHSVSVERLA